MGLSFVRKKRVREEYFAARRAKSLKHFKESLDNHPSSLSLRQEHVDGSHSEEIYKKQIIPLPQLEQKLVIITNQNLTHDTTLLFHSRGDKVRELLHLGFLKPEALTAKVIKVLGGYGKKILERQIKSRIISVLHDEKIKLLQKAQARIELLQEIELWLGKQVKVSTVREMVAGIDQVLEDYIKKTEGSEDQEAAREDQEAAQALRDLLQAHADQNPVNAEWLQTEGQEKILSFLKKRAFSVIRQLQCANQNLTNRKGSKAYLRGDLNSACEDASKCVNEHQQDFHTPMTRSHQLRYGTDEVVIDSDVHTDRSMGQLEDLLLGISVVGGNNESVEGPASRGHVIPTTATKWLHWRSFYDFSRPYTTSIFSSWTYFWKTVGVWCWNLFLSPFNLVETALKGNRAYYFLSFRENLTENPGRLRGNTDYYALIARLAKDASISTKIGLEIYKAANYLFVQGLWKGLTDGWRQVERLPGDLQADFQDLEESLEEVLPRLRESLKKIEKEQLDILTQRFFLVSVGNEGDSEIKACRSQEPDTPILLKQNESYSLITASGVTRRFRPQEAVLFQEFKFEEKQPTIVSLSPHSNSKAFYAAQEILSCGRDLSLNPQLSFEMEEKEQKALVYAQPEISQNPFVSHGILNGAVSGFTGFIDLFAHHMFAKHPFTGAVSAAATAVSFMAFLSPALATQLFGKGYVQFLRDQGFIWSKNTFSASMAGAFTNFKLMGVLVDGIEHGPESWLSGAFSHLANDPARTVTYITFSWLIGHTLVYWLEVPGLSEELRTHIGDPPLFSEIFGGAKLGLIAYHLFANPHRHDEELQKAYIDECIANYRAFQIKLKKEVTAAEEKELRERLGALVSLENVQRVGQEMREQQRQPRSPAENQFTLLLFLAGHKEKLSQLSSVLKARVRYQLSRMGLSSTNVTALDKYLDPERYAPKSTLRSFIGRAISYCPTLFRCVLSLCAGLACILWEVFLKSRPPCSWPALARPWKRLGSILFDDFTSTAFAVCRFVNKVLETVFNRLPRTLGDIFFNGIVARVFSYFGDHRVAAFNYRVSAKFDQLQEKVWSSTTGGVMTSLARKNTSPHPDSAFSVALKEKMETWIDERGNQKREAKSSSAVLSTVLSPRREAPVDLAEEKESPRPQSPPVAGGVSGA